MKTLFSALVVVTLLMAGTLSAQRGMERRGPGPSQGAGLNRGAGIDPRAPRPDSLEREEAYRDRDARDYPYYGEGAFNGDPYFGGYYQENYNYKDNSMYQSDVLKHAQSGEAEQIENTENMEQEPDVG